MPTNALDNPLVLPMLGLLVETPRHQYALLRELRDRYPFLNAKTSTVYTLVATLTRHGLIEPAAEGDPQPVRLTRAGLTDFRDRIERQLADADPNLDSRFLIALAYLGALPPDHAVTLLRDRARRVRDQHRELAETLQKADVPEMHMLEAHFLASRLRHDADWLSRTADRMAAGDLVPPR
ncbi:PadR family transcriptional regulator [Amycolatopsis benzoatilytica]|uniref:PadR family transcriptional regulator n=1 Tax=Amycolatopsis benzoatilytica TaxID=346045 RepID=UPI00035E1C24|nr:helix-turn-helix transcriptional regulator [Amycolatopsis benzoatilytica]